MAVAVVDRLLGRAVKRGGRIKTKRPTADMRRAEESARLKVWARASQPHGIALCEVCGECAPTEYQHRKAKAHCSKAELWVASNGLAVCGHGNYSGCHGERIHQQPTEAYANGWSVLSGQDPRKKRVLRRGEWVRFNDSGGMASAPDEDEDESRVGVMAEELNDQEHRETELWQVLDWSLWGNGLGDVLRETIADKTFAAITVEERETAERCIKAWHERRGPSMAVGEGTELAKRVAYLEARVGELHQTIGELRAEVVDLDDRRARWAGEHQKRSDELERSEASRRAWAEQAAALKDAARESYDELGDYIRVLTDTARPEITGRRVAATKAQRIIGGYFSAVMADWHDAEDRRVCACVTDEQAAQIKSAGPRWVRPQCAVHPDGDVA